MFSGLVSDCAKYYCKFLTWYARNETPVLLLVPTPLILSYFRGFAVRGSAENKNLVWRIVLTEYVSEAAALFVANASSKSTSRYYTLIPSSISLVGTCCFCFSIRL